MSDAARIATPLRLLRDRFGMDSRSLEAVIETALSRRVDHADFFFEYTTRDAVVLEEGIVKSGDRHLEQGVGVRAQAGERQGYAHSDEVSPDSAMLAATTARAISEGPASPGAVAVGGSGEPPTDLYPVRTAPTDVPVEAKIAVLNEIDAHVRRTDPRIKQVMASIVAEHRNILIAASDGTLVADVRPLVRINVQVIAENQEGRREAGYQGAGGRFDLARLLDPEGWKPIADEAVRSALVNLEAKPCPAGTMDVVLGPGWPGILLHEAIGHGMEADFNRKGTSIYSTMIGETVANEQVTIVDSALHPHERGSLNVDDEGNPTEETVLVDKGVMRSYLHDRLSAKHYGVPSTGSGRRESFRHLPMPRMRCTYMRSGPHTRDEIIASVDRGIVAETFLNGQVQIGAGDFTFYIKNGWLIEGGKITAPIKDVNIIGSGPEALKNITMVADDAKLDEGGWTCGKNGQAVPVSQGMPTALVSQLTVGGEDA